MVVVVGVPAILEASRAEASPFPEDRLMTGTEGPTV